MTKIYTILACSMSSLYAMQHAASAPQLPATPLLASSTQRVIFCRNLLARIHSEQALLHPELKEEYTRKRAASFARLSLETLITDAETAYAYGQEDLLDVIAQDISQKILARSSSTSAFAQHLASIPSEYLKERVGKAYIQHLHHTAAWKKKYTYPTACHAQFSIDGTRLAFVDAHNCIRIYDTQSGSLLLTLQHHTAPIYALDFSHSDTLILSASDDNILCIWNSTTGKLVRILTSTLLRPCRAQFSADATYIIITAKDGTHDIWDTQCGKHIAWLPGQPIIAISPTSTSCATALPNNTVNLYTLKNGKGICTLRTHDFAIRVLAYAPHDTALITAAAHYAYLWDLATGTLQHYLFGHTRPIVDAHFSPDGQLIATASHDGTARLWQAYTGTCIRLLNHASPVMNVLFSPDNHYLITTTPETVCVWDAHAGMLVHIIHNQTLNTISPITSARLSADGAHLLVTTHDNSAYVLHQPKIARSLKEIENATHPRIQRQTLCVIQ